MFDHVTLRVTDLAASARFYRAVLSAVGITDPASDDWFLDWGELSIAAATPERPVTRRAHIGLSAESRALVDEFWRVGKSSGYRDDGNPGPRPQCRDDYCGAFLLDPDGNSIEAVHHSALRGQIDHVWLRVSDVNASTAFYELVARFGGCRVGSGLTLVAGEPSENVHLAFPASDNETVEEFHRALVAAGHRDEGAPGERAVYHPRYYGAYVLDPDGNVVEVVNHNR